ncbi:MAG TPA: hypothetical protein VKQ36_14865 [Ktedonobacterales bacterium]|nr:hypothetical protein [Ktedonobacterales bacterium]
MITRQVIWLAVFGLSVLGGCFGAILALPHLSARGALALSLAGLAGGLLLIMIASWFAARRHFAGSLLSASVMLPFGVFAFGVAMLRLWWLLGLGLVVILVVIGTTAHFAQRWQRERGQTPDVS